MSLSPPTLPQAVRLVHVRAADPARGDPQLRRRLARLHELGTPAAWRAAVLALMLTEGSEPDVRAWQSLVAPGPAAWQVLDDVAHLPPAHRLPWFEHFARALAPEPVAQRQALIVGARSLLTADGIVSPMDQLRWIALRHLLAGSAVAPPAPVQHDFEGLDAGQVHAACVYAAFLSLLVPVPEVDLDPSGRGPAGQTWYELVTASWSDRGTLPARTGHDVDAALRALRELQAMSWLLRPMLVRSWYDGARALTEGPALNAQAADALRLSCTLLDSPVPPELGRQYSEVAPVRH